MNNENLNQSVQNNPLPTTPGLKTGKPKILVAITILVVFVIVMVAAYFIVPKGGQDVLKKVTQDLYKPALVFASKFATYEEVPVKIDPKVPAYTIDKGLSNVSNLADFQYLSEEAKNLLEKNAFVVQPTVSNNEFFPLYEANRYSATPSFVTTDSMLHNYHLMFDFLLKQLEEQKLATVLEKLSSSMLTESLKQYDSLKGTEWENAAKRNVGFFTVGNKLINPSVEVPAIVKSEVEQELKLISYHKGITLSPLMNIGAEVSEKDGLKEDYSQYIPRGHYDKTEQLKAYFKSMMWYGRLTFRLKNDDEIKSGILITLALNKEDNKKGWDTLYEPINFFVGNSDDITYYQFKNLVSQVYGETTDLQTVATDSGKKLAFVEATKTLEPPQLNSMPIYNSDIQPDREKEIKGFRFMGQRFTIDAAIFQRLIDREVPSRMLPKGLDIPAALGSKEALNILTQSGDTKYKNYSENMSKM